MATVYRAVREGIEGFERRVAVKVLNADLAQDPEFVEMFRAEARLAARLSHPVLVPVNDLGCADRMHFMAMDLLEGLTLADLYEHFRKKKKPFPREHALWICARVCEGLHYAHELKTEGGEPGNVVHRDVSPRNIFITVSGAVRLVDFGIARSADRKGQTQAGIVKGTVPYMAPEQARAEELDGRADIFALGVVLHQMLTGQMPLKPSSTEAQRQALALEEIEPELKVIHLDLRPAIRGALAPHPDDRFPTADQFSSALDEALETLHPDHQPAMLAALVSQVSRRREKKKRKSRRAKTGARPSTSAREPRDRSAVDRAPRAGETSAQVAVVRTLPDLPEWDVARLLALSATFLVLLGFCYTFMPAALG